MYDLNRPGTLRQLSKRIRDEVDMFAMKDLDDGHRAHLGASLIGEECERQLYYGFRWCGREHFDGRMLRLFERGHREEAFFVHLLRGIGFKVNTVDPASITPECPEGEQYRIEGVNGHFGGSCDGRGWFPETWGLRDEELLFEFKTNGTGGGFNALTEDGVTIAKPKHWAQMCTYGFKMKIRYAVYMCVNKNDDVIYPEVARLNWALGEEMERRADRVINARIPPARISPNPSYGKCKYCFAADMCHANGQPERNCRSCQQAQPVANKEWFCHRFQQIIPPEFIAKGCDDHCGIK